MLSEDEKNDLLNNIENDIKFMLSYYKTQLMGLRKSQLKLYSYEAKIGKIKTEKLKQIYLDNIQHYKNKAENYNETVLIICNYYKSFILEKLEKIDNTDFKKFIEIYIDFIPDNKQKIIASELYHIFRKKYNSDISFVNFNTLMKQLKLKYDCSKILEFHGLVMK